VTGAPELPSILRAKLSALTGQDGEATAPEEIRTRGDLILVRMQKDLHEERVAGPIRAAVARQNASLDTLVEQANDQARSALAKSRQQNIRARHVFQTTDDDKFDDTKR
jgi:hypothetical protein